MTTTRRGIALTPMETRPDVIVRTARLADRLGYEVFVLPEGWGLDATVLLAHLAGRTEQIRLVAGVLSIWGRTPATIAMAAASLHQICAGRFVLGLGASTPALVEGWHRVAFAHPAARLEAVTREVRNLLGGHRALLDTRFSARPLALGLPVPGDVPIWIAALGKRTYPIAAQLADGWFPAFQTRASLLERADRRSRPLTVAAGPMAVAAADPAEARAAVDGAVAWYLCAMGPDYARTVADQGHADAVRSIQAANPRPRPSGGVVPSTAARLLAEVTASGTPEQVRQTVDSWDSAVDITTICLPAGLRWDLIETTLRAAAP